MNTETQNNRPFIKTPAFPDKVYHSLPKFIQDLCTPFVSKRERDVALLGILAVLSSIFKNVKGSYSRQTIYSNLFVVVLAPPASGKGVLKYAKEIIMPLQAKLLEEYKNRKKEQGDAESVEDAERSNKVKRKLLIIPGNTSNAAMIKHLSDNDGSGLIFETEIDTLTIVLKNDWGDFSDLLRKAFHAEAISLSRKKEDEYLNVDKPKLAIALSGTPSQIRALIPSVENGLFSRVLFYVFDEEPKWKGVGPKEGDFNYDEYFTNFGNNNRELLEVMGEAEREVRLKEHHWDKIDDYFDKMLKNSNAFAGTDASSIVV